MVQNPRGFVPSRHLTGGDHFRTSRYVVSANNPGRLFKGDPVELGADGKVRVHQASAILGARGVLGVVNAIYDSNNRPLTHSLPGTGQFLETSTAGFLDVIDDPDVVFVINSDATGAHSDIGQFTRVTAGSANTAAGISGFSLKMVDVTASAVSNQQFRIIGVAPKEEALIGNDYNQAYSGIVDLDREVIISDHEWRRQVIRVRVSSHV